MTTDSHDHHNRCNYVLQIYIGSANTIKLLHTNLQLESMWFIKAFIDCLLERFLFF